MINRIIDYFFPRMNLEERNSKWCFSIGKNASYGKNLTHEYFDSIGFPKRRFFLSNK